MQFRTHQTDGMCFQFCPWDLKKKNGFFKNESLKQCTTLTNTVVFNTVADISNYIS